MTRLFLCMSNDHIDPFLRMSNFNVISLWQCNILSCYYLVRLALFTAFYFTCPQKPMISQRKNRWKQVCFYMFYLVLYQWCVLIVSLYLSMSYLSICFYVLNPQAKKWFNLMNQFFYLPLEECTFLYKRLEKYS